jgi:galactokinase
MPSSRGKSRRSIFRRLQPACRRVPRRSSSAPRAKLRDATLDRLETLEPVLRKRARHVITETARVEAFAAAAERGDTQELGRLVNESHRSLRDDYEVSCAELDFLVESARQVPGVLGSRMTGGGLGGSTMTLMRPEALAAF